MGLKCMHGAINYLSLYFCSCQSSLPYKWTAMRRSSGPKWAGTTRAHWYPDQENGSGVYWDVFHHRELQHWSDVMTAFPSRASATGEGILHCQGSLLCQSTTRLDRQPWIIQLRNTYFWLGMGRKHSSFQTFPKLCILLVKWCLWPV